MWASASQARVASASARSAVAVVSFIRPVWVAGRSPPRDCNVPPTGRHPGERGAPAGREMIAMRKESAPASGGARSDLVARSVAHVVGDQAEPVQDAERRGLEPA